MNSAKSEAEEDFKCPDCPRIFNSKESFDKHLLMHVHEDGHECEICKAVYLYKHELKQHVLSHSDDRPFKGIYCAASYKTQRPLYNHLQNHHSDSIAEKGSPGFEILMNSAESEVKKTFQCPHCPRVSYSKGYFDRHLLCHADENPHECKICKAVYFYKCDLKRHMLSHSDERPFKCKNCDASYKSQQPLDNHLKNHHCESIAEKCFPGVEILKNSAESEVEKIFKCPHCPRIFSSVRHYQKRCEEHLMMHADVNRPECEICKDVFRYPSDLRRHMITHSNEGQFNCEYCDASYKHKKLLDKHLRNYHSNITIFCKLCLQICTPSTINNHDCDPNSLDLLESYLKEAGMDGDEGLSFRQVH